MEHAFGSDFTVGIEEELLLVDPATHALSEEAEGLLPRVDLPSELADHEVFAAQIELRSPPCASAEQAGEALRRARAAARDAGATLMACGLHPTADWGEVRLVDEPRYRHVAADMRGLITRTPECALHVHVGLPDPETAVRVFNGLREALPLLGGLSASSPFWMGRDSGLASARAAVTRAYPARGVPSAFESWAEYEEGLEASAAGGGPTDYTRIWWDIRLHPRLGTVEVREMDVQSRVEDAVALAALVQVLARNLAEGPAREPLRTEAIAWSAFAAMRDGVDAEIAHEGGLTPVREIASRLAREHRIEGIERILAEGGGATRQREAAKRGGLDGLLDLLVRETAHLLR
jgi:glutamate---cysteine ligase / carboxylate-amine ligase